jgi:hypothetical protein
MVCSFNLCLSIIFCAVSDAKTAEFKFFKKLYEQSGHRSHSYKHSHLSAGPNVSKQKQGMGLFLCFLCCHYLITVYINTLWIFV